MHTDREEMTYNILLPLNLDWSDTEEETEIKKQNEAEDEIEDWYGNIHK